MSETNMTLYARLQYIWKRLPWSLGSTSWRLGTRLSVLLLASSLVWKWPKCIPVRLGRGALGDSITFLNPLVSNANCMVQYGLPDNTSRPGGALEFAMFHSKNTSSTFMVVADKSTVSSLIGTVKDNCSSYLSSNDTSSSPTPYTNQSTAPGPEQAIQYYRASTVVLVLDGYDSGVLNGSQNLNTSVAPVISLPNGTDTTLLTCLNDTIGRAVPLIDAGIRTGPPAVYTLLIAWLLAGAFRSMFWF